MEESFNTEVKNKRKKKEKEKEDEQKEEEEEENRPCWPWLRRSVAGLSLRRPGFDKSSISLKFLVDNLALIRGLLRVFRFSPVSVTPQRSALSYSSVTDAVSS